MRATPHRRASWFIARIFCALVVALLLLVGRAAHAGEEPVAASVGAAAAGLPGIGRVAIASPGHGPHVAAGLSAGYGFTERLEGDTGPHHRGLGTLGLAIQPIRYFAAALTLDGRFEKHPDDRLGASTTAIGEPRLLLRGAKDLGRAFALGAQLVLLVPGAEAPSLRPAASTLDASALFTFAPPGTDLAVGLNAGYRVDQTADVLERRPRIRTGDRLTIRASDFDAVLLGLGASKRVRRFEVLGELTWDLLVGTNAPAATDSPLRAGAGVRYHLGDDTTSGLQLELRSEVDIGGRPGNAPNDRFAPIDPRFAAIAGLRYTLPLGKRHKASGAATPKPNGEAPPPAPAVVVGSLRGHVKGDRGEPIADARVAVTSDDASERATATAADGGFALDDVRTGRRTVVAKAPGYDDTTTEATIAPNGSTTVDIVMKRTIRPGQLRGLVRSFDGKPLAATIRIEPIGVEAKTDADGAFQVDVPPGTYQVLVAARGYAEQRRPVQVEENGVTILNADLRRGK